jgi:hypothetical protein
MRSQVNMTWHNVPHHHITFFSIFVFSDHGMMDYNLHAMKELKKFNGFSFF